MNRIIYPVTGEIVDEKVIDTGDTRHSIIKLSSNNEWMCKRAEMIMLRERNNGQIEIFLQKKEMYGGLLQVKFPSGSVDDGETFKDTAIRECKEESLCCVDEKTIVGDVGYKYSYIIECDDYHPWVAKNIPEEYRWKTYFTKVFAAYYSKEYTGVVADADRDDIATEGKWYLLTPEIDRMLIPAQRETIRFCMFVKMTERFQAMPGFADLIIH